MARTCLVVALLTFACSKQAIDMSDLSCAGTECLDGYVCHPETGLCAPEIAYGCESADTVCPTTTNTGDACTPEGAFIPCVDGVDDCSQGCRTCVDGAWSDCSLDCTLGEVTSCSSCDDDCTTRVEHATPICDTVPDPDACSYDTAAGCDSGFFDADGMSGNGCECSQLNGGTEIACNNIDEDCSGADQIEEGTLANCSGCGDSCEGLDHVQTPACNGTPGAYSCAISVCAGGWANQDGVVSNGCETACITTNGGNETCDGIDNDCNGLTDDAIGDVDADCDSKLVSGGDVDVWACTAGACTVTTCDPDFWDIDGLGSNGCEHACSPTGAETCDGVDNDCNAIVDDIGDPAAVLADCNTILGDPPDVTAFVCELAACGGGDCCRISGCIAGKTDADGNAGNGCELDCVVTGVEVCDTTDNDCNGVADDGPQDATDCIDWLLDVDGDTYGVTGDSECWCLPTGNYRAPPANNGDCDDSDPLSYPGAAELCDGNDNPCDGSLRVAEQDSDGDGYVTCGGWDDTQSDNPTILGGRDCAPTDAASHPGATELCDGNDNSCSGTTSDAEIDGDGDNYVDCTGWDDVQGDNPTILDGDDCDDGDVAAYPGATEVIGDGTDQSCDGQETCYVDADDDGYRPDSTSTVASADMDCSDTGEALGSDPVGDCADGDITINPGATEGVGDGIDQNCDNEELCYQDSDDDGYRPDPTSTVVSVDLDCTDAFEAIATDPTTDCADGDAAINPGATETVDDGVDQNCDNEEFCYLDNDDDGYRPDATSTVASTTDLDCTDAGEAESGDPTGDCADDDDTRYPTATEVCNNIDDDCDLTVDNDPPLTDCGCANGSPPAASEDCGNSIDDDCNEAVNDGCATMILPSNLGAVDPCQSTEVLNAPSGTPIAIDTGAGTITGPIFVGSVTTTTIPQTSPPGPTIRVFYFDSINIGDTVTVSGSNALALVACNDIDISGTIDMCASGATGGPGGYDGGTAAGDGTGPRPGLGGDGTLGVDPWNSGGGGGGGNCGTGGDGGYSGDTSNRYLGGTGGSTWAGATVVPLQGGSGGGAGDYNDGNKEGGGGGGAIQIVSNASINITGTINACGAGGGGPSVDGDGGGGGGSGGAILIEAMDVTIINSAAITANGGGGGGGDDFGAPTDATTGEDGPAAEARADGGPGCDGNTSVGGNGGRGGALDGTDINGEAGVSSAVNSFQAGGGGGGAGFIRVNTDTSGNYTESPAADLSPFDAACQSRGQVAFQ